MQNKFVELFVDTTIEESSIYYQAEDQISDLALEQINYLWMDHKAVPNVSESVKINFSGMELELLIMGKTYEATAFNLQITLILKLLDD